MKKKTNIIRIKVGDLWVCKKTVVMKTDDNWKAYIEGKVYKSEQKDCLTNERGEICHFWTGEVADETYKLFFEYFKKVPKNKRSKWKKLI